VGQSIRIEVGLDTAGVDQGATRIKSAIDSVVRPAQEAGRRIGNALDAGFEAAARKAKELGDTLSGLGTRLTLGLTAPLSALGAAAVKTATDFDSLRRGLTAVSGSASAAEKQMARLKEVAKLPGLGFKEAIQGAINLQAAGFSAERAEKALRVFGNALATVGKGKAELDGVILALSQIETKGKVSAEEINQLAERVPQIRRAIVAAFGTADTEVIQKAKITSKQFTDAVVKELERLPQVTGGARNTFENLKDSIEQSLLPLGNKLLQTILPAIEKIAPKVLGLLDAFGRLSSETQQLILVLGGLAIAVGPVVGALGNLLRLLVEVKALGGIGAIFSAAGPSGIVAGIASINPVVLGLTALVTAGAIAWFEHGNNVKRSLGFVDRFLERQGRNFGPPIPGVEQTSRIDIELSHQLIEAQQKAGPLKAGAKVAIDAGVLPGGSQFTAPTNKPSAVDLSKFKTGGGEAAKKAIRDAQQLFEAQQRLAADRARSELDLLKDANERALREDERAFNLRLLSAKEFFDNKRGLLEANIGNEINDLNNQLRQAEEALGRTKKGTADRADAEGKILDLRTKVELKTRELGDVEGKVFSESLKARSDLLDIVSEQLEVAAQESEVAKKILADIKARATEEKNALFDARERLKLQGKALDRELLEVGSNLDLKTLNASKQAILDIRRADEDAILSQIRNRELLADKTVFHAARSNAAVLDFLQQQVRGVTEIVSDARIGVIQTLFDRIDAGIGKLTQRFGIFKDVIAQVLSGLTKLLLSKVFQGFGSAAGGGERGGGGIGGFFGNLFGGLLGGGGGNFRTPSFVPGGSGGAASLLGGAASNIGQLLNLNAQRSAAGIIPTVTAAQAFAGNAAATTLSTETAAAQAAIAAGATQTRGTGFGGILGAFGSNFSNLFKGFGFGLKPGSAAGGLAAAAPLLGLTLGIGAGGSSTLGKIIGGAGGALLGIGLTAAPAIFGAGGALASPAIAALFSNLITAIVGGALLVGAIFLGRAAQRRKDEAASGDMLTQALNSIRELKRGISTDQIDGSQAKSIFENQILAQFIQQISGLKTKSVRESRLTNQVRDLRAVFEAEIPPEVELQRKRRIVGQRLVPEFALGGIVPGRDLGFDSVAALLRPGEMVLTKGQQSAIATIAGAGVFQAAGVPNAGRDAGVAQAFQFGGVAQSRGFGPTIILGDITLRLSRQDVTELFVEGAQTDSGQDVLIRSHRRAQKAREL